MADGLKLKNSILVNRCFDLLSGEKDESRKKLYEYEVGEDLRILCANSFYWDNITDYARCVINNDYMVNQFRFIKNDIVNDFNNFEDALKYGLWEIISNNSIKNEIINRMSNLNLLEIIDKLGLIDSVDELFNKEHPPRSCWYSAISNLDYYNELIHKYDVKCDCLDIYNCSKFKEYAKNLNKELYIKNEQIIKRYAKHFLEKDGYYSFTTPKGIYVSSIMIQDIETKFLNLVIRSWNKEYYRLLDNSLILRKNFETIRNSRFNEICAWFVDINDTTRSQSSVLLGRGNTLWLTKQTYDLYVLTSFRFTKMIIDTFSIQGSGEQKENA